MGLVTDFGHKYQFDPFFRTECNIIALQVLFAACIIFIGSLAFNYFYQSFSNALLEEIATTLGDRAAPTVNDLVLRALEREKINNLLLVGVSGILAVIVFGYLVARVALTPARNALSSQKRFIGNIAHELRTPLSIIKTNTEVALLDDFLADKFKQTLRSNVEELDRISDIINNLLSFNNFVRPERIEFRNVDMGEILERVVGKLSYLSARKKIDLTVRKGEFRTVWGNATAVEQIAMNLIKNAISYTPLGGHISVTLEPNYRGYIELWVADSGVGISRKDLFRIFEPFYRADQSRARQHGGSGLGLAIVNELVKLHHGKIAIKSAVKRGTTVTISLPCGINSESKRESPAPPTGSEDGEIAMDFSEEKM